MKVNSAVVLTLTLLALMIGAGVSSAIWGFALGSEALKGVTQPDSRPLSTPPGQKKATARSTKATILKEEDILETVAARIEGGNEAVQRSGSARTKSLDDSTVDVQANFPISTANRGVTLDVTQVRKQGNRLIIDMDLRNDGGRSLRFLDSFLIVMDEGGRTVDATPEGLPRELPPYSETAKSQVFIPYDMLRNSRTLTLSLTDYPEQQVQLELSNIPIAH